MALGDRHVCVMHQGRTVCWGTGTDGQLGIGSTPVDTTPTVLPDSIDFVRLAAGQAHTCGLDSDGAAFCWGRIAMASLVSAPRRSSGAALSPALPARSR
jgi:alpha-tubulin suppressor-like RCC1 family protein